VTSPQAPVHDRTIYPVLVKLADCLSATLAESQSGPVARTDVIWSEWPDWDFCDCETWRGRGRAWVKYTQDQVVDDSRCTWSIVTLHIGVVRCLPVPDTHLGTVAQMRDVAARGLSDRLAIRRAVNCCEIKTGKLVRNDAWGPEGRCYGNLSEIRIRSAC
jgi:hypothetical protein